MQGEVVANNRSILIETDAAVGLPCTDSPAAHTNPILLRIVTATDNHSLDELFSVELIHLNMVIKSLEGDFNNGGNR